MVRTLQRKFIFASMLTVTILLVTLVCAINILNYVSVTDRQNKMLDMLCATDAHPWEQRREGPGSGGMQEPGRGRPDEDGDSRDGRMDRGSGGLMDRHFSVDDALSVRFFAVWFDGEGNIVKTDVSRIYAVTEDGASQMAQEILALGKSRGLYQGFRFLLKEQADSDGERTMLAAMDVSGDREDILSVLGISAVIAVIWWAAMLLPVIALARRAIAPTALSIERQKQFVTNAGHELKTPVAIIQANTEALELYKGETKWTRNIRAQTVRLNRLMQNLLTLARMDENALRLEMDLFSLDPLIREVWGNFSESAAAADLSFDCTCGSGEDAYGNRESIAQLMSILFDNAVKYTPKGGKIGVNVTSESGKVRVQQFNTINAAQTEGTGAGTGPGLPEDPERLFERFYRPDSGRSRRTGGFGIGLSAARAIAEANRGTIRAQVDDGRIIFTLTLQKKKI